MALKQVVLHRKRAALVEELRKAEQTRDELKQQRDELNAKELETEEAINEITEETSEEDKAAVEAQADELIQQGEALKGQEAENQKQRDDLQEQINQIDDELKEIENRAKDAVKKTSSVEPGFVVERKEVSTMETRKVMGLTYQERATLFARDDVKPFLERAMAWSRKDFGEKRAASNGELFIPRVLLGIIRENLGENSKLMKHVKVQPVPGTSRMLVDGVTPEAVWTEMCGKLNELDLGYGMVEMDGYKVGGYIPICNALLEDATDPVSLGTEIMTKLARAIGIAVDKAILYGTGTKMPLGIVTRLAQTADPGTQENLPWENLSATNMIKMTAGLEDAKFFKAFVRAAGAAKSNYAVGGKFWAMNEKTKTEITANAVGFNAAGAVVSGVSNAMPVVGGVIEELSWIPDNVVIGGYGENYVLAERAGTSLGSSSEVRFIEDQTVFKGVARYDGMPVAAGSFVAIDIAGGTINPAAITFAEDKANAAG